MSSGKVPGNDGIPSEVFKFLTQLYITMWSEESVSQVFKDAMIVPLYKWKGDGSSVDNYRGATRLSDVRKIFARIILDHMSSTIGNITPESQWGFLAGRDTSNMMFAVCQLQEKSSEQHHDLYIWSSSTLGKYLI